MKKIIALAALASVITFNLNTAFSEEITIRKVGEEEAAVFESVKSINDENTVIKFYTFDEIGWNKACDELYKYGIVNGYPDGDMKLFSNLTRAEAAVLLFRMQGFKKENIENIDFEFTDIESHWAASEISFMKKAGLVDDVSGTDFEPEKEILTEEFTKCVVDMLGYKPKAEKNGGYSEGYIKTASELGITADTALSTDNYLKRGEAFLILQKALDVPIMAQTSFGSSAEYTVMNGQDGAEYITLRKKLTE